MGLSDLKIVIWCGAAPNHRALANKIATLFPVAGIVIDTGVIRAKKRTARNWISLLMDRFRFQKIYNAWKNLMRYYDERFGSWPTCPIIKVAGINTKETESFTHSIRPDLVVVSGTGLIKEPLLNIGAKLGTINLHTGLSPFVKGGPNCTNWCIANNDWHLVGNTIFWLNAGIDAGNIITTETVDIRDTDSLDQAHQRVMEHAHELYIRAISYLMGSTPPFNSIPQDSIGKGKLYLTKMWTAKKKKELLRNWKNRKSATSAPPVKTIPLKDRISL